MESLSDTTWDIVLAGTSLPQSLLALALSRSGKKVLHIDKNDYYGGSEAALSLQDAEVWAANSYNVSSPFKNAAITTIQHGETSEPGHVKAPKLDFSRAYNLSLSPHLVYTRSNLLPVLVSSKVYRQLDFLAVGSWWLYSRDGANGRNEQEAEQVELEYSKGRLWPIPGDREDVFADKSIDRRSMMLLMKFLKLATDSDMHVSILDEWGQKPFSVFLRNHSKISPQLHDTLFALTLSPNALADTLTSYALPRIHRHLTSIGIFGPGFGSVVPKWGGLAEISQVACRASAVGGGVYVLKKGFEIANNSSLQTPAKKGIHWNPDTQLLELCLKGGEEVKSRWVVGSHWDLPPRIQDKSTLEIVPDYVYQSITVVSGILSALFPTPLEGVSPSACAVVVFPIRMLRKNRDEQKLAMDNDLPSIYLMVHSSDTGECPAKQCVIYGLAFRQTALEAHTLLEEAVRQLLASVNENPAPVVLWSMHYDRQYTSPFTPNSRTPDHFEIASNAFPNDHVIELPDVMPSVALEDEVLRYVRTAYERIVGENDTGFMKFDDRGDIGIVDVRADEMES